MLKERTALLLENKLKYNILNPKKILNKLKSILAPWNFYNQRNIFATR